LAMSDECKYCDLRGKDRKLCEYKCWCYLPESWYAQEIRRENEELRGIVKAAGERVAEIRGMI
jgi:hypothetical protein